MWIIILPLVVSFAILIGIWYYTVFSHDEWDDEDDYLDNDDWIGH